MKLFFSITLMLLPLTAFSQVNSYRALTYNGRSVFQISSLNPIDAAKAVLQQCTVHNTEQVCTQNLSIVLEGNTLPQPWLVSTYNKTAWKEEFFFLSSLNPGDATKGVIAGCMDKQNTFQVCVKNLSAIRISE